MAYRYDPRLGFYVEVPDADGNYQNDVGPNGLPIDPRTGLYPGAAANLNRTRDNTYGTNYSDMIRNLLETSRTTSRTAGHSNTDFNSSTLTRTAPFITREYKGLEELMRNQLQARLQSPESLPEGFAQGGLIDLNRSFKDVNAALSNRLAAQGVQGPAAGAATVSQEGARASEAARFLQQLPLIARSLRSEDLDRAAGAIGQFGRGTSTSSTTTGSEHTEYASQTISDLIRNLTENTHETGGYSIDAPYHPPIIPNQPDNSLALIGLLAGLFF